MFKTMLTLLITLLLPIVSYADMRDPTQPHYPKTPATTIAAPTVKVIEEATPVLSAIWQSANSRRATLNGITAKEGQTILNTVQIISIRQNKVIIKQNNTLKTLQLVHRPNQNISMP
ncbi:MAG: hypothetical protein HOP02_14835 [Methylococcaceae bacterium]|nr:hypothetical protein [Methylococcaceae bacterium]